MSDLTISAMAVAATLTGTELVPVVQAGDNAIVTADKLRRGVVPVTLTTTAALPALDGLHRVDATAGSFTVTLPTAASAAGCSLDVVKIDSTLNVITIEGDGAELIGTASNYLLEYAQEFVRLTSDGAAWRVTAE